MRELVIIDADGRAIQVHSVFPEGMPAELDAAGVRYVLFERPTALECWFPDGIAQPRPRCPAEVEPRPGGITITGLPPETAVQIVIEGETLAVRDGEIVAGRLDIDIDEPGPVGLVITPPWPYLEARHDLVVE